MKTLLVLVFTMDGWSQQVPVGLMLDGDTCIVAGSGMTAILEMANPGLQVEWMCTPVGGAPA